MSYSSLASKYVPAISSNYMKGRGGYKICKITPHHMACKWTAERCAQSFQVEGRLASANYCIGSDGEIVCNVDEENRAYTSSNYYNDCQSITIEVANDNTETWSISDKAWNSLVNLCVDVCKRYGFRLNYTGNSTGSLTEHRMFASTSCPGPYLHARMAQLASEVNAKLDGTTSTPTVAPSSEKYSVGLPICTNKLSVNCYGTGKVLDGDWSGTIGRVINGAKFPYRVDRNGVAIGWTNDQAIDSDPHVPQGTTQTSSTEAVDQILHAGSHVRFTDNLIVDAINIKDDLVHCNRLGGWVSASICRETSARDGKNDQILNVGAQFTIDGRFTVSKVDAQKDLALIKELGFWVRCEPLTEVA